jgi:glycosyltransferase involved in cell wall biosynthesis
MTSVTFAIPGDLSTRTGGYGYARALIEHLPAAGIEIRHCALPASFPLPSEGDIAAAFDSLVATAKDDVLLIDGLAFGALPAERIAALDRRIVALVHHPLGYETGLDEATQKQLIESERHALACADHVIVSSDTTRDVLIDAFGVPGGAITIAEPGTRPVTRHSHPPTVTAGLVPAVTKAIRLLAVGSITPRKGFDILVEALSTLGDLDWRLRLVGSPARDPATAQALRKQIAVAGLRSRIDLVGELAIEPLDEEYRNADLFVLSSHYEGYGMVLAEAMAHGLPIVTTTGGAAARTVPDDAALKVPPGDSAALAEALRRAIEDIALRRQLACASLRAGDALPRWPAITARVAAVLHRVAQKVPR